MGESAETNVIAVVSLGTLLSNDTGGVRSRETASIDVVMERALEDWVEVSPAEVGDFCIRKIASAFAVLSGAVEVLLVDHVLAQAVLRSVFEARKNAVVSPAVEIDALVPRDFGSASEQAQAELCVVLRAR